MPEKEAIALRKRKTRNPKKRRTKRLHMYCWENVAILLRYDLNQTWTELRDEKINQDYCNTFEICREKLHYMIWQACNYWPLSQEAQQHHHTCYRKQPIHSASCPPSSQTLLPLPRNPPLSMAVCYWMCCKIPLASPAKHTQKEIETLIPIPIPIPSQW